MPGELPCVKRKTKKWILDIVHLSPPIGPRVDGGVAPSVSRPCGWPIGTGFRHQKCSKSAQNGGPFWAGFLRSLAPSPGWTLGLPAALAGIALDWPRHTRASRCKNEQFSFFWVNSKRPQPVTRPPQWSSLSVLARSRWTFFSPNAAANDGQLPEPASLLCSWPQPHPKGLGGRVPLNIYIYTYIYIFHLT